MKKVKILLFWLAVWSILAILVNNRFLVVSPWGTAAALGKLLVNLDFYRAVFSSLLRIGGGFVGGTLTAFVLAFCSAKWKTMEEVLLPFMKFLTAVPVASFAVLLLIWWGSSMLAVSVCFLVVLPNIYINTLEGIRCADRRLLEMAEVFQLPVLSRFLAIYRPALRPFLYGAFQVSLGMSWKSGVAAEVIGVPSHSVGEGLYLSKVWLDTAGVFAWTVVVIALSFGFEKLVLFGLKCFFDAEPRFGRIAAGETSALHLTVENLEKSFGEQKVLSNVNLQCGEGECVYLREPSGSGKTTLLRILAGLEKADGGRVVRPHTVSMLFQEDRLCETYSAVKNVELVTGDAALAREALEQLLPAEELDKPCVQLSGGMKRRVALVRAMEAPSRMVLLDEPFNGLDAENREKVEKYISERQNGRPIVISTHI